MSSHLWMKYGGHEDLHGSGHRSITPYVHGRCVYCCVCGLFKAELNLPKRATKRFCLNPVPSRFFYISRSGSYIETWGPIGGPKVVETLYNIFFSLNTQENYASLY
jgi:hypothetical protein